MHPPYTDASKRPPNGKGRMHRVVCQPFGFVSEKGTNRPRFLTERHKRKEGRTRERDGGKVKMQ